MIDADLGKTIVEVGTYLLSTGVGIVAGAWRRGRHSAQREQKVKDDYDTKITTLRNEFLDAMSTNQKNAVARNELLVEQFKESFEGMRRQMDKNQLETEKEFMRKEDFRDFREEYREDMRDLKKSVAELASSKTKH